MGALHHPPLSHRYILAARDQQYVVVYYRGSNDAWDGYGGAVVYTRTPSLEQRWVPEIAEAVSRVGLRWEDFSLNDNSCRAAETKLEELEADLELVETRVAAGLQLAEQKVEAELRKDVDAVEREIEREVVGLEKEVVGLEKEFEKGLQRGLGRK